MRRTHPNDERHDEKATGPISRRAFLGGALAAVAAFMAGCAERAGLVPTATVPPTVKPTPTDVPTDTPVPPAATATPTAVPTATAPPTAEPTPTDAPTDTPVPPTDTPPPPTATPTVAIPDRAEVMRRWPDAPSRVVVARHNGVLGNGDEPVPTVVRAMLAAGLTELTGIADATAAWRALFDPSERVAIKVNTISRYTTNLAVALAVAESLNVAGLPAENIVIYDRSAEELQRGGYAVGGERLPARIAATADYRQPRTIAGTTQILSNVLLDCDALINIPILKEHGISGVTFAMKNHYGSIANPAQLHPGNCDPGIAELNAQPEIRDKTRLVIGDVLRLCPYDWDHAVPGNTLLFSFDPVAHDAVGLDILASRIEADGRNAAGNRGKARYITTAAALGLGTNDRENMEVRELALG